MKHDYCTIPTYTPWNGQGDAVTVNDICPRLEERLKIHTYIIGHYNPSIKVIDLVSHTTYVVCVLILYLSGGTYSLKSTPNDRFFEKLFMAVF